MDAPVGLFDSGFGGLTVMRELVRILPSEDMVYLGDTANLPYGNKSPEVVLRLARQNAAFLIKQKIKLLVIPCHTACCHALESLYKEFPIPIIGVIEPGLRLIKDFKRVAILATQSTVESGLYQKKIREQNPRAFVLAKACPLFVPLIEEGFHEHSFTKKIAKHYLGELKGKVDAALLACTHYPLIRAILEEEIGPKVKLIEPALECAILVKEILTKEGLLKFQTSKPSYRFFCSDDPKKFQKFGFPFFGSSIEDIEKK
jgi:glutamate racemase